MLNVVTRDYEGLAAQFTADAWFNATVAAERFGKLPNEWLRLPETKAYLEALKRKYGKIPHLRTKRGNNGGTWLHPKLAVPFARWLDIDFSIWCDGQIDNLIRGTIDVRRARHQAAVSFKVMQEMLRLKREESGKQTAPYHYGNEARLINGVLTGKFSSLDRGSLSFAELDMLAALEQHNTLMLASGVRYRDRKAALAALAGRRLDYRPTYLPCRPAVPQPSA